MKTRILFSLIVALSWVAIAIPALAEPEPDLEVNAAEPTVQPECGNAASLPDFSPFAVAPAAVGPDAVHPEGSKDAAPGDLSVPVQKLVNCSLWPPNCPCSCIQDCHDQSEACHAGCSTPICRWGCRQADMQCTAACCGD